MSAHFHFAEGAFSNRFAKDVITHYSFTFF